MADYPCDIHGARYSGPSHRIYVNVYRDDEEVKLKLSVCKPDLETLFAGWLDRALFQTAGLNWDPCSEGQELDGLWKATGERSGASNGRRRP